MGSAAVTAAASSAAHQRLNAIRAFGVVVRMEPAEWLALVGRQERPLVVVSFGGVFRKRMRYLTTYRGLAFYTESAEDLTLPTTVERIDAAKLVLPDM